MGVMFSWLWRQSNTATPILDSQVKPEVFAQEPVAEANEPTSEPEPEPAIRQEGTQAEKQLTKPEQELRSAQEVVSNATKPTTVEIKSVEQVITQVPELVSCTFDPKPAIAAELVNKVEPKTEEQVIGNVAEWVRCTFEAEQPIEAKPAVKLETEFVEQVVASVPEVISCTFDPEPEQVAVKKVTEEVVSCTLNPELAIKVESGSIEQCVSSVLKLEGCNVDPALIKQTLPGEPEQVELKAIPEPEPKEVSMPKPVVEMEQTVHQVAEQVVTCSLDSGPGTEAIEPGQVVVQKIEPDLEVVACIPQKEPAAEGEPVAVKSELESLEQLVEPTTEEPAEIQEEIQLETVLKVT
ncbi:cytadherence high molecular weight protein 1 isoform X2 [Corythoichthys intestinalis]|uniref:cytadherence high molecular weight protein 1 isoform X2 n=1 Tax=Corythoichthys intestinalis TaxID=161448 RepID=UPI0025A67A8E|nr:cytadherence high molecular weight protein 1 isoform X2 [Corythoichthys intestinalis]